MTVRELDLSETEIRQLVIHAALIAVSAMGVIEECRPEAKSQLDRLKQDLEILIFGPMQKKRRSKS
jgi:hypothetical protein